MMNQKSISSNINTNFKRHLLGNKISKITLIKKSKGETERQEMGAV
jgi:hypothetical protein